VSKERSDHDQRAKRNSLESNESDQPSGNAGAVTLPVEIYSDERMAEFEAAEGELSEWYERNES